MTETTAKPQPRILDLIEALLKRERCEEALTYMQDAAIVALAHGLSVEEILGKTVDEYIELLTIEVLTVPEKRGYDKVFYGEEAFKKVTLV